MMNCNAISPIAIVKAFLPQMIKRKSGQIVNILSLSAVFPTPVRTLYCASKYALDGFGKSLRAEAAQYNVQVTHVYPAYVQTNMSMNAMTGSGHAFGKLDENIKKGMPVHKAGSLIIKATYLQERELYLCGAFYKLVTILSAISGNITYLACLNKYKDQVRVKEAAIKA